MMRPLRLLLAVCFLFVTVFLTFYSLLQSHPRPGNNGVSSDPDQNRFKALLAFRAPSSLFPPSAIISLTDDNTTFFLSRPAMYGPGLPGDGLSGELWVGSGFGDDTLVRGGVVSSAQGELGCSDIPGWTERSPQFSGEGTDKTRDKQSKVVAGTEGSDGPENKNGKTKKPSNTDTERIPEMDDGTDEYLHYPLHGVPLLKGKRTSTDQDLKSDNAPEHADIQALQESAEIAGKVVLLSRGGCGFLEKTKWVQRRGGVALIVGDYTRGGPLINMYAHGDTSNVTIPSIFTAHTSAHLLSSLVPPINIGDASNAGSDGKASGGSDNGKKIAQKNSNTKPTFTPAASLPKQTSQPRKATTASSKSQHSATSKKGPSWLGLFAASFGIGKRDESSLHGESRRPPSSGELKWVQSESWDDEPNSSPIGNTKGSGNDESIAKSKQSNLPEPKDTFVIGVHDWRDPDLVGQADNSDATTTLTTTSTTLTTAAMKPTNSKVFPGGSRLPGSGVYGGIQKQQSETSSLKQHGSQKSTQGSKKGWWASLFNRHGPVDDPMKDSKKAQDVYKKKIAPHFVQDQKFEDVGSSNFMEHQGLWVTITPTSVSTSPFFDTLLVLVVSPLVTLTVVYALLLLRSRIRRRRWRAPRSVVDRLPVRTYHTMSYSSTSTSSSTSSPHTSSPTSPLLQSGSKAGLSRTRPRSRTTSTIRQNMAREDAVASLERATANLSGSSGEKDNAFKRKYSRKQVECVVCLEEYIDGQSQVMSLPCGHEFHAECITPWLTTRRRTCPICKGDVVRSMNRVPSATSLSSITPPSHNHVLNSDDIQAEVAQSRNESPTAAIPIPGSPQEEANDQSDDLAATLVNDRPSVFTPGRGWRTIASRGLSSLNRDSSTRSSPDDRSR